MIKFLSFFKTKKSKHKVVKISKLSNSESIKKYGKTNKQLCKIYKGKSIRDTPKNWAYNKCIKKNTWEKCKSLPPQGWTMWRDFC